VDDLYNMPGHLIRRAQQIGVAIFMEECSEYDITPVQYACLRALKDHPNVDATRLSAIVAFDRSTIGSVLERLEIKKLIQRCPSPDDKRIKLLRLDASGARLLAALEPALKRVQKRILEPLDARSRRTFIDLLTRLVHLNNEASRAPLRLGGRGHHQDPGVE